MSVKIYEAYRLKEGKDLWEFAKEAKERAQEEARKVLSELYKSWMENEKGHSFVRGQRGMAEDQEVHLIDCMFTAVKLYKEQLASPQKNPFHFDISISVRRRENRHYLLPHCGGLMGKTLDFLNSHPDLEEYGYWNNTDRPEGVGRDEWLDREEIWDEIMERWKDYLLIEICSIDNFVSDIDPWFDMEKEMAKKMERAD